MCSSPVVLVGFLVLLISVLACALSFAAPFWMLYTGGWGIFTNAWSKGLWADCFSDHKCKWYWEDDFQLEKNQPDWYKASQGLFAFGLIILLIAFLASCIQMCCCCCKASIGFSSTLASLCLSAGICIGVSLGVYGGFISKDSDYSFYWAFFVGIGGAVAAVVASILFFCESGRARSYSGYHMTRVV